jgi:CelD/BcsL family acetyltransferase involved in cellulose biosynthesis
MRYTVIDDNLAGLKKVWLDPHQNLYWPSIFVLPDWLQVWWQVFGSPAEMMVRTVREGEEIIGIAPLMLKDGTAFLIGDTDVCDYLDFIITPGMEEVFFRLILDDLKKNGIGHLDLKHLRPDSPTLACLAPLAEIRRYPVIITRDAVSLEMDLPSTWDEYLASLSGKQRHEVRRKLRRLGEKGHVAFHVLRDSKGISEGMDIFFRMFVESRQAKSEFLTQEMRSFFVLLAEAMSRTDLLNLGCLTLDAKPVAEILYFDYNNGLFLYNSGFDPAFKSLSAGLCCKILAIEAGIKEGKKKFDFLKGPELYKVHLGGREVPLYRCRITLS